MRLKTLGAATLGTLALGACDDPVADTDLRPEGPPDVLAVLVFNDTVNGAVESATYCKPNDPKRPGKVGIPAYEINPLICPLDGSAVQPLTDAWPDAWYVRIMFDELLDPDIETLEPILDAAGNPTPNFTGSLARTQPVTLRCQDVSGNLVDVDYDGYYSPSGNRVTWPLGPSLVIQPLDPTIIPVESECEVTLKESIKDKEGLSVPDGDRTPFKFRLAPVTITGVSPAEDAVVNPTAGGVSVSFNVTIDENATFCATAGDPNCFSLTPAADATNAYVENEGSALFVGADLLGGTEYTFTMPETLRIKDKCGKESTVVGKIPPYVFETNPARFLSFNPGGGNAVAPSKKLTLSFNQLIDTASFTEGTDFEMNPKPANFAIFPPGGAATSTIQIRGDYNVGTRYTFTIKAGAQVSDIYGRQTIAIAQQQVADFTTAGAIAITAQSPANNSRVATGRVTLTFNQEMTVADLLPTMYSLTRADGTAVPLNAPTASGANVVFNPTTAVPAGNYKFTFKAGAILKDRLANQYTQMTDRVINFTVAEPAPPGPDFKCLGAP